MRPRRILSTIILAATVSAASAQTNGTWTNLAGGSWAEGLNWSGGNIADGIGAVADLSTLNITAATTVTLDGPRTLGTLRFGDATTASHDWTLSAGTGGALTLATASGPAILQVNNRSATISAPISGGTGISVTGPGNLILSGTNTFTGQVTVAPNATLTITNDKSLGAIGAGNETIIQSGGVLNLAVAVHNTSIGSELIRIAGTGINNAGAIVNTTSNWAAVPNITLDAASSVGGTGRWHFSGAGTLDLNGHKLTKVGSNQLVMSGGTVTDGDIDVNAGTLSFEAGVIVRGAGTVTVASGAILGAWANVAGTQTRAVAMNAGSILRELGSPGTSTLSTPITLRGNISVIVNPNANGLSHLSLPAGISESGGSFGFTRTGDGKLTLGGANTFTGTVDLNAGATVLAAGSTLSASTINLASGATLDFSPAGGYTVGTGQTLSAGRTGTAATDISGDVTLGAGSVLNVGVGTGFRTLTLANSLTLDGATVNFDIGAVTTAGSDVNDLIAAGQTLTLSGTNTFALRTRGASPVEGKYTLATYGGTLAGGAGNISIAVPVNTRQTFTPDTTTTPGKVLLDVAGAAGNLTWVGSQSGNAWNLNNTSNFTNGATGEKFLNLDTVTFTDAGTSTVNLSGTLEPALVTVNNPTKKYTFAGAGKITGNTVFIKSGAGTLEITGETHDFTGGLTINEGTVSVPTINAAGVAGPLGAGPVTLAGGTLEYAGYGGDPSSRVLVLGTGGGSLSVLDPFTTFALAASPTGTTGFSKTGPGTLLASYSATYSGGTTIKEGILKLGNATALGNTGTPVVTVLNGASLDANGIASPATGAIKVALTIEGDGPDGLGGLRNSGVAVTNNNIASSITLLGDTSIGTNTRYDIDGATFNGGTFTLTKKGSGETWWSPAPNAMVGNIIVEGGRLGVQRSDNLGSTAHSITVKSGAQLSTYGANTNAKPIILQGGMLHNNSGGAAAGTAGTWNGTLTLEGSGISNRIDSLGGPIVLNGKVTGPGGFEQLSSGGTKYRVDLSNADNDWKGETQLTSGTLRIVGTGRFSSDSLLSMNGAQAIFDGANTAQTVKGLRGTAGVVTNVDLTVNDATDESFGGQITGAASKLTKSGNGTLTLVGDNTYQGATRIRSGVLAVSGSISGTTSISVEDTAILRLSGELNTGAGRINNSAAIQLGDATPTGVPRLDLDPLAISQISEQMGALTLSSDAIIDFGENFSGGILRFADSSALSGTWNGTLKIWNWTGNMTGTGIDQLFFGTTLGGLTANQLGRITFFSDEGQSSLGTATFLAGGNGQIVPVPEPTAALHLVAAALGLGAWRRRRS